MEFISRCSNKAPPPLLLPIRRSTQQSNNAPHAKKVYDATVLLKMTRFPSFLFFHSTERGLFVRRTCDIHGAPPLHQPTPPPNVFQCHATIPDGRNQRFCFTKQMPCGFCISPQSLQCQPPTDDTRVPTDFRYETFRQIIIIRK